jgi:hypothetical protein
MRLCLKKERRRKGGREGGREEGRKIVHINGVPFDVLVHVYIV